MFLFVLLRIMVCVGPCVFVYECVFYAISLNCLKEGFVFNLFHRETFNALAAWYF